MAADLGGSTVDPPGDFSRPDRLLTGFSDAAIGWLDIGDIGCFRITRGCSQASSIREVTR